MKKPNGAGGGEKVASETHKGVKWPQAPQVDRQEEFVTLALPSMNRERALGISGHQRLSLGKEKGPLAQTAHRQSLNLLTEEEVGKGRWVQRADPLATRATVCLPCKCPFTQSPSCICFCPSSDIALGGSQVLTLPTAQ